MPAIELKTEIPGPRSRALMERRRAAVPAGLGHSTPVFVASASGARVTDVDGNRLLDFAGGIGTMNMGHAHPAVVAALKNGGIAAAALDVIEGEPDKIDPDVYSAPNLLFTPHAAGRAPEQEADRVQTIRTNLENHMAGKPVVSPVKEMKG